MYQIIDEKIIGRKVDTNSDFLQLKVVHIVCDTAASVPEPLPEWAAGSRCDVLADSGTVYILSISGEWKQVNFYNRGGSGGDFDPDSYYTKPQTDARITEKVAEIVADAPEDFDTLKEISDWISSHEDSAAAMNSAIQANTTAITGKVDKETGKGLSTNDYTTEEKTKLASISANASDVGQLYPNSNHGEIFNNYENSARPNVASGDYSHAEGGNNTASGTYSHVEGAGNTVSGNYSHAEGGNNTASGTYSHVEGYDNEVSGNYSHVEGEYTIAASDTQHVQGRCNVADTNGKFAFIIGNGTHWDHRSNAFAVDWNGLIYQNNSATGIDLFSLSSNVDNKVDKVSGKGLSTNDYTTAEKEKLAGIATGANKTVIDSALNSSSTNPVQNKVIKKSLDNKVDKISGKGLSTNDYTTAEKTKLAGIPEIDTTPTENSNNLITSGGVYSALQSAGGDNFSVIEKIATPSITLASGQMQTFDMWIKGNEVPFSNVIGTVGAISRTSGVLVAGSCLKGPDPLGTGSYVSYTVYNITDSPISEWQANIYILVKS